jgi:ABC-type xylose transport system permease subunit
MEVQMIDSILIVAISVVCLVVGIFIGYANGYIDAENKKRK